jgi:DNA-binding beta-propeller fold protein YncE
VQSRFLTKLALCLLLCSAQFALGQTFLGSIRVFVNFNATDIAVNPLTDTIYVTSGGEVWVIDGRTRTVENNIFIEDGSLFAEAVAVNPITNQIYVATFQGTVSVIDGRTNMIVDTISGILANRYAPNWIAVNPMTNRVYVATANGIAVIDGAANRVLDTVTLEGSPVSVAMNYYTDKLYVVCEDGLLFEIDGRTNHVSQPISIGQYAGQVAVDVVKNRIFISTVDPTTIVATGIPPASTGSIYVVDGSNNRLLKVIPGFNGPIAVDPLSNRLWAVNALLAPPDGSQTQVYETVSLIDITRDAVVSTLHLSPLYLQGDLFKIVVNPVTNEAFTLTDYLGEVGVLSGGRSGPAPPRRHERWDIGD